MLVPTLPLTSRLLTPTATYVLSKVAVLYSLGVTEKASTHLVTLVGLSKYFLPVAG